MPTPVACPEFDASELDRERFRREFVRKGRPVLLHNALDSWPASERWADPEYLAGVFGDKEVPIAVKEDGNASFEPMPLSEFWRDTWKGTGKQHCYLEWPITAKSQPVGLSEIAGDIRVPPWFEPLPSLTAKMFAGWNTRSGCHYHPSSEAMLCQVVGKKRALLFSPAWGEFGNLYPMHWFSEHYGFSQVIFPRDGSWPQDDRFPRLQRAHPVEVRLEPGDALYIPVFWWHVVYGPDVSISVAHFWMASLRQRYLSRLGIRSNYVNKFLLKRHLSLASVRDLARGLKAKLGSARG
jgi:jumonji domain-containing protein 7